MSSKRNATKNTKKHAKVVDASGRNFTAQSGTARAEHDRATKEDFLNAVKTFTSNASKEFREELDGLVARAQRTGSKFAESASKTFQAADGRFAEYSGETARDGLNAVRRAAGGFAKTAGGFLEGLALAIAPKETRPADRKPVAMKKTPAKTTAKKKFVKSAKTATAKRR